MRFTWHVNCAELCERFANYFFLPNLFDFLAKKGMPSDLVTSIFGTYTMCCYGFQWLGGYLSNYIRLFTLVITGLLFLSVGYLSINFDERAFISLTCLVIGINLFKTNITALTRLVAIKKQLSVDEAVTKLYAYVNIGAFLSGVLMVWLFPKYGFFPCSIACIIGLLALLVNIKVLYPLKIDNIESKIDLDIAKSFVLKPKSYKSKKHIIMLIVGAFCFYLPYFQMNTVVLQYSQELVGDIGKSLGSLNAAFVILLPIILVYLRLSTNQKLYLGMLLGALSFIVLYYMGNMSGIVIWYFLISVAELFIAPIGQAYILNSCEPKYQNLFLGIWFISNSLAYKCAAVFLLLKQYCDIKVIFILDTLVLLVGFWFYYLLLRKRYHD